MMRSLRALPTTTLFLALGLLPVTSAFALPDGLRYTQSHSNHDGSPINDGTPGLAAPAASR